ncbi:expressed unknown protein [Ectocarpus siliculosus]|uniref:Uncharacterized protein n=1 Tax=Ectocarpus siliculosus TaxID=2880 RepID=D8LTF2_ECTSI|nr:expressed unknown protein [Ectocarpus siliculosus]|eukprot:CBN78062.1 expressed unknown protein [Ectocarpus siliculosus]
MAEEAKRWRQASPTHLRSRLVQFVWSEKSSANTQPVVLHMMRLPLLRDWLANAIYTLLLGASLIL